MKRRGKNPNARASPMRANKQPRQEAVDNGKGLGKKKLNRRRPAENNGGFKMLSAKNTFKPRKLNKDDNSQEALLLEASTPASDILTSYKSNRLEALENRILHADEAEIAKPVEEPKTRNTSSTEALNLLMASKQKWKELRERNFKEAFGADTKNLVYQKYFKITEKAHSAIKHLNSTEFVLIDS